MSLFDANDFNVHPAEWMWPGTDGVLTDDEAAELLGWTGGPMSGSMRAPMVEPMATPFGSWGDAS